MPRRTGRRSPKRFDATLKSLVEEFPADWIAPLGLPFSGSIEVIDADLSTISAQADKVLRMTQPTPWLIHIELQASKDRELPRRVARYSVLLHDRHGIPVHSVIFLLRPEADDESLTGVYRFLSPLGGSALEFRYQVVRVWEQNPEIVLSGGVGALPLLPLTAIDRADLLPAFRLMNDRLSREVKPAEADILWASTLILMGMRYNPQEAKEMIMGIRDLESASSTYRMIKEEGAIETLVNLILRQGTRRWGNPDANTQHALQQIKTVARLEPMLDNISEVTSWEELLASV